MRQETEPVDIEKRLADPKTYEDTILRIFSKKSQRGQAFCEIDGGITYFGAAIERRGLSDVIARIVAVGLDGREHEERLGPSVPV